MANSPSNDWSPADNPYAIAVSEAQWWKESARLAILRMRRNDDARLGWFSSQQIDARQLVFALRQLLSAEKLEQFALEDLGIDQTVREALTQARLRFEQTLPGIKDIRDGLMHFEDWSRGMGRSGPQAKRRAAGDLPRDIARDFWGFGFDPASSIVSFGPYFIDIDVAEQAARELAHAIYMASREVDKRNVAELRLKTIAALTIAGVPAETPTAGFKISPGNDLKVWISMDLAIDAEQIDDGDLAARIVAALTAAKLRLVASIDVEDLDLDVRLARGEALYVEGEA